MRSALTLLLLALSIPAFAQWTDPAGTNSDYRASPVLIDDDGTVLSPTNATKVGNLRLSLRIQDADEIFADARFTNLAAQITTMQSQLLAPTGGVIKGVLYIGDTNYPNTIPRLYLWNNPNGEWDSLDSTDWGFRYRGIPVVDYDGNIYIERLSNALANAGVELDEQVGLRFTGVIRSGGGEGDGFLELWNSSEGRFDALSFRDDGMFWSNPALERRLFSSEGFVSQAALIGALTNGTKRLRVGGPLLGGDDNDISAYAESLGGYQGWRSQDNGLAFLKADEGAVDFTDTEGNVYRHVITNALREIGIAGGTTGRLSVAQTLSAGAEETTGRLSLWNVQEGYEEWLEFNDDGLYWYSPIHTRRLFSAQGTIALESLTNALLTVLDRSVPASNSAPGFVGNRASIYTNGQFYVYEWFKNARGTNTPGWIRTPPGSTNW